MTDAEFDAFSRLLGQVHAFYRRDSSLFAVEVWWQACRGYPLEAVRAALSAHARDPERGAFAPYPADVVRQLEGRTDDRALLAWHRVLQATQAIGHYGSVDFGDPLIHAAIIDAGGWQAVCCAPTKELDFLRRRFCESYRAYAAAGAVPFDTPRCLAGEHERSNAALGYVALDDGAAPVLPSGRAAALTGARAS